MTKKKTTEEFIVEVKRKYGNEYTVIGKYNGNKNNIAILHNICREIFYPTPNNFLRGHRCFRCYGSKKLTTQEFKNKISLLFNGEYDILTLYKGSHHYIMVLHKRCGHIYKVKPYSLLQGHGCSWCNQLSIRENFICEYLKELKVNFIPQAIFDWTYPKKYRYDFYLPQYNYIIEYNGQQHYKEVEVFEQDLDFVRRRDEEKLNLAKENDINILIIPYWLSDKDIKKILYEQFGGNE